MSASREKKQRLKSEGMTERERQQAREEQQEKTRMKIYTVIGVIIALLVAALLIWNSGFFQKRMTAVTIGDETYTVNDLDYYYYGIMNNTANYARTYAQYGIDMGYDPDVSPADQMYDEEKGTTYAEYFRQTAVDNLQQVALLCSEAENAGYTLSADGQASVDDTLAQVKEYSAKYGYSEEAYLKLLYGPYITKDVFLKNLTRSTLASEYQTYYTDSLPYTDTDLETYYKDHTSELDTYDFRYCLISGTAESTTDADGNTVEPTDEEKAAAMAAAKAKADEMVARYQAGEEFNALSAEYVDADSAESFADPEYNHVTDKLGSEVTSYAFSSWLTDAARHSGDIAAVEAEGSGYYVVLLNSRARLENSYQTVDVRHILVKAETNEAAADSTDPVLPTEAQLADAYAKAEDILNEWKAGAATSDSFAELANKYSDDPGSNTSGGLYKDVARGTMITSFNDWIFTSGREAGDTGIVVNTSGSSDDVLGYHVMYFQGPGEVRWKYQARTALASADYSEWLEAAKANYPVTTSEAGLKLVQ